MVKNTKLNRCLFLIIVACCFSFVLSTAKDFKVRLRNSPIKKSFSKKVNTAPKMYDTRTTDFKHYGGTDNAIQYYAETIVICNKIIRAAKTATKILQKQQ